MPNNSMEQWQVFVATQQLFCRTGYRTALVLRACQGLP
jgi:hypothetical protein